MGGAHRRVEPRGEHNRFSVTDMAPAYGARRSFDQVRPKMSIKFQPQSARKWIFMKKWACENWGNKVLKTADALAMGPIWSVAGAANLHIEIRLIENAVSGAEQLIVCCSRNFEFLSKMTIIWPKTSRFWPDQSSLAPPILVCRWPTMARWNADTKPSLFSSI